MIYVMTTGPLLYETVVAMLALEQVREGTPAPEAVARAVKVLEQHDSSPFSAMLLMSMAAQVRHEARRQARREAGLATGDDP